MTSLTGDGRVAPDKYRCVDGPMILSNEAVSIACTFRMAAPPPSHLHSGGRRMKTCVERKGLLGHKTISITTADGVE